MNRRDFLTGGAALLGLGASSTPLGSVFQKTSKDPQGLLEDLMLHHFSGLETPGLWCAIYIQGHLVAAHAMGYKNAAEKTPAKLSDRVVYGSISKGFAGTVLGAVIQSRALSYSDTLSQVFPGLGESGIGRANVAQFMVHHSGLANLFPQMKSDPGGSDEFFSQFLSEAIQSKPVSDPGERFSYGPGADIVAAMISKRTGQSFPTIMRTALLEPAGLTTVGLGWGNVDTFGHVPKGGTYEISKTAHFSANYCASGGVMGSILDLAKFGSVHAESRLKGLRSISMDTFRTMHRHIEQITNENSALRGATTLCGLGGWPDGNLIHDGMWYRGDYALLVCSPRRRTSVALYRNSHRESGKADFGSLLEDLETAIPILSYKYDGPGIVR